MPRLNHFDFKGNGDYPLESNQARDRSEHKRDATSKSRGGCGERAWFTDRGRRRRGLLGLQGVDDVPRAEEPRLGAEEHRRGECQTETRPFGRARALLRSRGVALTALVAASLLNQAGLSSTSHAGCRPRSPYHATVKVLQGQFGACPPERVCMRRMHDVRCRVAAFAPASCR